MREELEGDSKMNADEIHKYVKRLEQCLRIAHSAILETPEKQMAVQKTLAGLLPTNMRDELLGDVRLVKSTPARTTNKNLFNMWAVIIYDFGDGGTFSYEVLEGRRWLDAFCNSESQLLRQLLAACEENGDPLQALTIDVLRERARMSEFDFLVTKLVPE